MSRYIVCTNEEGTTATFGEGFSPFMLVDADGLYEFNVNVAKSDNTNINGSTYYGSNVKTRNIVLTIADWGDHKDNRAALYNLFRYDIPGTLSYIEDNEEKTIDYVVEKVDIDPEYDQRKATVSLLCPDPLFKSGIEYIVNVSEWQAQFEFLHEFVDGGEELGRRNYSQTGTIENNSGISGTGVSITVEISGSVTNPSIYNVENNQHITLGDSNNSLNLIAGDELNITTGRGNKHIYLTRSGVTTEINEYLTEDSTFIQLLIGTNTIGYTADSGEEYISIEVRFHYQYAGV